MRDFTTAMILYFERLFMEISCGLFGGHDYRKRTDGTQQCIKCGRMR